MVYNGLVLAILLFGAEHWCVTAKMITSEREEDAFSYTECHSNLCGVNIRKEGHFDCGWPFDD